MPLGGRLVAAATEQRDEADAMATAAVNEGEGEGSALEQLAAAQAAGDEAEIQRWQAAAQKEKDGEEVEQQGREAAAREAAEAAAEAAEHAAYLQRISDNVRASEHAQQEHYVDGNGEVMIEHLFWTFGCVLAPASIDSIPEGVEGRELAFEEFVVRICKRFFSVGLEIQLVARSDTSKHKVVFLLRLPERRFLLEFRKLSLQRWKTTGQGLEFVKSTSKSEHAAGATHNLEEKLSPTEADRIQVTAMLLNLPVSRGGCGLINIEHFQEDTHDPRVCAVFPLHNSEWVADISKRWTDHHSWLSFTKRVLHSLFVKHARRLKKEIDNLETEGARMHVVLYT